MIKNLLVCGSLLAGVALALMAYRSHHREYTAFLQWESWPGKSLWRERDFSVRLVSGYVVLGCDDSYFQLDTPEEIMPTWGHRHSLSAQFRIDHSAGLRGGIDSLDPDEIRNMISSQRPYNPPLDYLPPVSHAYGIGYAGDFSIDPPRADFQRTGLISAWPVAAALLLPAAIAVIGRLRRRQRFAAGRCPGCGYDLRASTGRCPECGAAIAAKQSATGFPPAK